jgi:hypothetical protein
VHFNSSIFAKVAWIGIALLAAAAVYSIVMGDWIGVLFLGGFLIASVVFVAFEDRLPTLFDLLFVSAALLNAVGWAWDYYRIIWGYDEIVHFYTTFAVTLSLGYLAFYAVREHFRDHRAHFILVISSFGISIGALWEIFEWLILVELTNPVEDLVMDTFGAVLAGYVAAWALGAEDVGDGEVGHGRASAPAG